MEKYVDVKEFSKLTGVTETYVRRLCSEDRLQYIREKLGNSSNTKFMIDLTCDLAQKMINKHAFENNSVTEPVAEQNTIDQEQPQTILEMSKQIEELAKMAGKFEQIEDLRQRDKDSAEVWEKRYFDMQQQVTELNKQIIELNRQVAEHKANNTILAGQIKQLKEQQNKGLFGWFKK